VEKVDHVEATLWMILTIATSTSSERIAVAAGIIKCMDHRAKLMGLYSPTKVALDEEGGLTLTMMRALLARKAEAERLLQLQQLETTAEEVGESATDENNDQSGTGTLTLEALRRAGNS
jgi:hypothetical protein